jgi:hypothetical protein
MELYPSIFKDATDAKNVNDLEEASAKSICKIVV